MALSFTGRAGNSANSSKTENVKIAVLGDGSSTALAVNLKSACFAPFFTDDNSVLPLQLSEPFGPAYFPGTGGNTAIQFSMTISTGTVTLTFASAPPANVQSAPITIGLMYP